ncbi:MAG: hypothetical protein GF355_17845 [Candidatus Eisenbacteria bacterium]|nr:hypothetical protein [Candidatus Eisenbacteria bacterium]
MDTLKAHGKSPVLLDLGDWLSTTRDISEVTNTFIFEVMEELGTAAIAMGERELELWDQTREFVQRGTIPFVSCNLKRINAEGRSEPLVEPYVLRTVNGVPMAFIGVIGGSQFTAADVPEDMGVVYEDPLDALPPVVDAVRDRAELVVLLAHMDGRHTEELVQKVEGIDVAFVGHRARPEKEPHWVEGVIVNEAGIRGQWAGITRLIVSRDGEVLDWGGRNRPLDSTIPPNESIDERVEELKAEQRILRTAATKARRNEAEGRLHASRFLGDETCQSCHLAEYEQWRDTPHAHAFQTLKEEGKAGEKECIPCHVTGHGKPTGFRAGMEDPDLRNVQCEACHGMGTEHVRGPAAPKMTEAMCVRCHDKENSPDFNFDTYLEAVLHR